MIEAVQVYDTELNFVFLAAFAAMGGMRTFQSVERIFINVGVWIRSR